VSKGRVRSVKKKKIKDSKPNPTIRDFKHPLLRRNLFIFVKKLNVRQGKSTGRERRCAVKKTWRGKHTGKK